MPSKPKSTISNHFLTFVGRVPLERSLNRKMSRHGNLVMSQRKPFLPVELKAIAQSIERHRLKINQLSKKPKPPKSLSIWKSRAEILQKMHNLGSRPQAMHLVAGLAFEHGLSKEKMVPVINAFRNANDRANGALFEGSLGVPSYAARLDLFSKISGLLFEMPRTMNAHQIASALKLDYKKPTIYSAITSALGVLDLMGLTRKLPRDKNRNYRWVHVVYRFSPLTIPKQNLDWKILQRLRLGEQKVTDLCLPNKLPGGTKIGSKDGLATGGSIAGSFLRMQKAGLVSTFGNANSHRARLTDYAAELLQEQDKLNYLHPKLRIAMLGLARQPGELLPRQQKMLNRILRWVKIHMELSKVREEMGAASDRQSVGYLAAARNLRENARYVLAVAKGYLPWRGIKESKLIDFYLGQLKKKNPKEAEYFGQFLSKK